MIESEMSVKSGNKITDIDNEKIDVQLEHEKASNAMHIKPFTWAEIRERIILKYCLGTVAFHAGCIAAIAMYTLRLSPDPLQWWTILWGILVAMLNLIGVTGGAHRLWSHRSFKAKLPLRIMLMIFYSGAGMYPIYYWARDHRVHHQYTETDADPHSAKRGFFYSHVGWVLMKRHPDCMRRIRQVNMDDILADKVVMFQKKYYQLLIFILCFIIPTAVPIMCWEETFLNAALTQCVIRYMFVLNAIFCINSVSHFWGDRPYNRLINPTENWFVSLVTGGEGSHNYHHTFAWDYKAAELPWLNFNNTTMFIDLMAKLGWAYDLREPSPELIDKIVNRIGHKSVRRDHQ